MATYKNKEELKNKCLSKDDTIIFTIKDKILIYRVTNQDLVYDGLYNSVEIFILLDLNRYRFADKIYGYKSGIGYFPKCVKDDYQALTRITIALFKECEKVNNMRNITLPVSKETLEEMYKNGNKTLKKIAIEACPELVTPKLTKFLKDNNISRDSWNTFTTCDKARKMANCFNKEYFWYEKTSESAYEIYWDICSNKWEACKADSPAIGTVLFKTYDTADLAANILNECEIK